MINDKNIINKLNDIYNKSELYKKDQKSLY